MKKLMILIFSISLLLLTNFTALPKETTNMKSPGTQSLEYDDSWPMFKHDSSHSGYSTSTGPETNSILWTYPSGSWIRSSPAVEDGKVYFASYDSVMFCLDMNTGEQIWNTEIGYEWLFSSPAVANGKVYIGSDDGYVYCLNADNGSLVWRFLTTNYVDRVDSPPTVSDGKVYIGSNEGHIFCLDAETGSESWRYYIGSSVYSSPAVANGKVYIGSNTGNTGGFYCLNASNGNLIWDHSFSGEVESSPTVANQRVFFGANDGNFYCYDADTGTKIWSSNIGRAYYSSPSFVDGKIYTAAGGTMNCLNADTGEVIWKKGVDSGSCTSPAVADGKVYIGSQNINCGHLTCMNADTGEEIWDYTTDGWVWSSPAIADGKVYIGSCDGLLYCFGYNNQNAPPTTPTITGKTSGRAGFEYGYTFVSTDPEGGNLYLYIDWGASEGWLPYWHGPYKSGQVVLKNNSWDAGTYTIRCRARDASLGESDWGYLQITMPKARTINTPFLLRLLQQFPHAFPILRHLIYNT